jgi:hypothetical protein
MPTASAASEIAPTPHPRDELKSLALEADQFYASDDWKNADAPTRQKYLDRTAEVFDEAFASAESSLDAAEADSFYNSTTAFLQGKMAEHNSRDADEKRRRAAADKSMQVFTERQKVTPEQVSGVVKRSLEVAGGMSAQTRGSGVMKLDGEQGKPSIGVQPLDWTPSAEEFWKDRYDLTASQAEKLSARDFARSKGKEPLANDLLYRSEVAGEERAKLDARDYAFSKGEDAAGVAAAEREATIAYRRNAKLAELESTQSSAGNPKGRKLPFRVVRTNGMLNIEPEEGKAEETMLAAERMGLLTSEEAARLIPSGVEMDKEFASRPKAQGGLVTAVKEFGSAILPALGTAAGTAIGAAASKGDVSTAMVGGASGGSAALWLQNKVFGQVDQAQREANARAHPGWAQVGSFVPFLVSMFQKTPPALTTVGKMAQAAKVSLEPGTAAARWESALQSGVAMGRAGFSSGVQQRYVEGNKDVNPIDEGVRSFIAGGAMGILKPAKGILMAMTGKAVKDAAAVTFAEGLYDLAVHNKPIDFKAIADEAPGTFTAFALQNAVMGVFHKFQHRREMAKMAGKSAAAANTAAAEAAEAQAKRFRKDGFIESAIASEALAETHRRAAKQDEKAATEQYWQDVAKAQKRAVEHTQANEGPLTERAAYGRTGDVYDAFGNVQRKPPADGGGPGVTFQGQPLARAQSDAGLVSAEGAQDAKTPLYDAFGNVQRKVGEPKNEKAQSVPSVQKADEPVRLPQKEVAPAAPSPEPVTPAAKPVEQATPAPKDTTERIQEAAYRDASGRIYKTGAFHDSSKLPKKFQADNENARGVEPGWFTSSGRFVGREEGFAIAAASKQVKDSYKAEWPNVLGHFNVKPETLGKQSTPAQIEQAIADANWLGTVREVPAPRSMGGEGVKLYIPVDASGKDVSVGGQTILGKTPAEAIELAQKNTKPTPAPAPQAPAPGVMTQAEMDERIAVLLKAPTKTGGKPRVSFKTQAEEAWFRRGFEAANGKPGEPLPEQRPGVPAKEQKLHDAFAQGWSQAQMALRQDRPTPAPAPSPAVPQAEGGIFGYSWADIRSKQQGGTLAALIRGNAPKATESDFAVLEKHGMDWLYDNEKFGIIDRLGLPVERPSKKAVEARSKPETVETLADSHGALLVSDKAYESPKTSEAAVVDVAPIRASEANAGKIDNSKVHPSLIAADGTRKQLYHGKAGEFPDAELKINPNNMTTLSGLGPAWFTTNKAQAHRFSVPKGNIMAPETISMKRPLVIEGDKESIERGRYLRDLTQITAGFELAELENTARYKWTPKQKARWEEIYPKMKRFLEEQGVKKLKGGDKLDKFSWAEPYPIISEFQRQIEKETGKAGVTESDPFQRLRGLEKEARVTLRALGDPRADKMPAGEAIRLALQSEGYDGIVLLNTMADTALNEVGQGYHPSDWVIPFTPEQVVSKAATPAPAPAPVTEAAKPAAPKTFKRKARELPPAPGGGEDVIDYIINNIGKLRSRGTAFDIQMKQRGQITRDVDGTNFFKLVSKRISGEYDGLNLPPRLHAAIIAKRGSGVSLDEAAQMLFDAHLIRDAKADTMHSAIHGAYEARLMNENEGRVMQEMEDDAQRQSNDFAEDSAKKKKGTTQINILDLSIGDVVEINGEKLTVIATAGFDVTLEDGEKYGIQDVDGDAVIYGKLTEINPEPVAPKLRPGEDQGELVESDAKKTPEQLESERLADEAEKARLQKEQDWRLAQSKRLLAKDDIRPEVDMFNAPDPQKDIFDKDQPISEDPFAIADSAPTTSLPVASVQRAVRVVAERLAGAMPHEVIADGSQYPERLKYAMRQLMAAKKWKEINALGRAEILKEEGIPKEYASYAWSGLPESVKDALIKRQSPPTTEDMNRLRGAVSDGKIYINAAAIEKPREAIEVFMHEAAGHGGVDALLQAFGEKATTQLDAMLKRLFEAEYADVKRRYEPQNQVRETLAMIMEGVGPEMSAQHRTRWQRVVDWLRNALNKLGVKQWSTNDVMALLRRGVDAVRKQRAVTPDAGAVRMSYAGEKAQVPQFMRDSLDTAKAMAAAGKTSKEIRAVTGWFPGKYDGKMRWEVPDEGATWTDKAAAANESGGWAGLPLEDVLDHPSLFEVYPSARNIRTSRYNLGSKSIGGRWDGKRLELNSLSSDAESFSSLLHEVQHWIQENEGFAQGADPAQFLTDSPVLPETVAARVSEISKEIDALREEERALGEFFRNLPDSQKGVGRQVDKSRRLEAISSEIRKLREEEYSLKKPHRDAAAIKDYRRTAGEIESRDVQARQNFTPEQRKAVEPYSSENIAKEDAIVMRGGGPQMSVADRVTPEQDRAYADAVKRGDMETAQAMVDKAAKAAGYGVKAWRGSSRKKRINDSGSVWLTSSEDAADSYARDVFGYDEPVALPYFIKPDGIPSYDASRLTDEQRQEIGADEFGNPQQIGIYRNSDDSLGFKTTTYHVPVQAIKIADPITRDASGRVIPLSKRFNPDTSDIRFSLKDENPEATSTTKKAVMDKEREVAMLQGSADKLLQDIRKSGRPPTVEEMQQIAAIDSLIAKRQAEIQAEASNVAQGATPPEINIADLNAEPPDREETGESGPRTYGGKFDSMDAQRAERGLPPLARRFRKANRVLWDAAVKRFETEPKWADRLVDEISSGEKTVLTDEEFAGVFAQQIDLHNKRQEAADRARDPNLSEEEQRDALDQFQYYEKKLQASEILKGMAGSEAGAALQSLKLMANEDFSLAAMEARERKAKQSGLTPEEADRIRDEATRIAKAQADLDARKAATEAAERIANAEAKIAEWSKIPSRVLEYAKQKLSELVSAGNAAGERLRARAGQVNVGVDPTILGDIFLFARGKIAQGIESFGNFAASTASEFGEWVSPYLKPAWDKAMKYFSTNQPERKVSSKQKARQQAATKDAASIEDGIRAMAEEGLPDDMGRYVKQLANEYVKSGATTVKGVMARLHAFLDPVMGNPTDDVLLDLWTDYGKGKAATEDALKRLQSQIRQEALIVRQIIDAEAALVRSQAGEDVGDYLKLTGQQRVPVRDQARALAQQLNELKKKIPPPQGTAESRRQSALDALEKRTRNRIKDLRFEIAKGERTIKNRGVTPTSPNLEALRAELATVEAEHLAVFGRREATPEQKLKSAIKSAERAEQKALAELEAAKRGVFTRPVQKGAETRNEVLVIRARADAARAETQALKELASPPLSDAQKRLDAALVARERWEQMLAGEQQPTSRQPQESLTQLEEDARMEIAAMRELAAQIRRDAKPATDPDDAKVRALEAAAAEYERRVNESDFTAKSKTTTVDSARVAQARALRDAALAAYNAAKNAAGVTEQTKIANRKAAMLRQIADLTDRLAKSDFEKRPPRPPVDLSKDPEAVRIASDLQEIKSNYAKRLLHYIKERRGGYEKFTDAMWTAITAERSLMGSGDLSAPRQGIRMAYSHPIMAAKAIWRSIRTIFSQKQAVSYEAERKLRPNYALYKPMKIQMPSVEAEAHDRMAEEGVRSNIEDWADIKLSGNPLLVLPKLVPKLLGHYVRASSRTFTTFLNELAADVADYRINELRDKPMSKIEKEALGDMINSGRGRGLKAGAGKLAQFVFYSANFLAARAKNLSGYHIWRRNSSMRIRKIALKEQFRAIAGWMVVSAISRYFYGDTGDDEDILDKAKRLFKLRVTDSDSGMEYDYTGGEAKLVRIGAALIEGISTTIQAMLSGQEEADKQRAFTSYATIGREIRSISAPWVGVATDLFTGSNYDGKVPTVPSIARDLTVPLAWRSADEFFERAGFAKTVVAKLQEAIGVGVSVTRDKTAPKERRYSR